MCACACVASQHTRSANRMGAGLQPGCAYQLSLQWSLVHLQGELGVSFFVPYPTIQTGDQMLNYQYLYKWFCSSLTCGGCANAVPPYQKFRTRVSTFGRSQASTEQSAMPRSPPGGTACLITVSPVPGKLHRSRSTALLCFAIDRYTYGFCASMRFMFNQLRIRYS